MAATKATRNNPYVGQLKKQLRDGYGVYTYENRFFTYEGEWKAGFKHGHGKLSMGDGSYYEGEFANGEIMGHGCRFFSGNGNLYTGQFYMGELHGQGVMKYKGGGVYEGQWQRNSRNGYGVLKSIDDGVYQGYLHNNRKHGEGTQFYNNGDRYDGDWIMDKRQGHGKIKERNGTIYEGQWHNHMFNGQGLMLHASGMYYEGLWVNGQPSLTSTQLCINSPTPRELQQGIPFSLEILCLDDDGNRVEDMGRNIQVTAGFKFTEPVKEESSCKETESNTGLFDMIEDIEDKPIQTPFGYCILPYPITDRFEFKETDEGLNYFKSFHLTTTDDQSSNQRDSIDGVPSTIYRPSISTVVTSQQSTDTMPKISLGMPISGTTTTFNSPQSAKSADNTPLPGVTPIFGTSTHETPLSDMSNFVTSPLPEVPMPATGSPMVSPRPETKAEEKTESVLQDQSSVTEDDGVVGSEDHGSIDVQQNEDIDSHMQANPAIESAPTQQPIAPRKSSCGAVVFTGLILTTAPPMYRPFNNDTGKKQKSKPNRKQPSETDVFRCQTRNKSRNDSKTPLQDEKNSHGDDRFARAGEYVIMAQDITEPPFLDKRLRPAFLLVKIKIPKKQKKHKESKARPKWDTSKHIASNMNRIYNDTISEDDIIMGANT